MPWILRRFAAGAKGRRELQQERIMMRVGRRNRCGSSGGAVIRRWGGGGAAAARRLTQSDGLTMIKTPETGGRREETWRLWDYELWDLWLWDYETVGHDDGGGGGGGEGEGGAGAGCGGGGTERSTV